MDIGGGPGVITAPKWFMVFVGGSVLNIQDGSISMVATSDISLCAPNISITGSTITVSAGTMNLTATGDLTAVAELIKLNP